MRKLAAAALLVGCTSLHAQYSRTIQFSGYTWMVKKSAGKVGPGPNIFSDSADNVWVDSAGRLHMKITRNGNRWNCAEVILTGSFGHGTYRFYLDSPVDNLDPNVVLGLFTWNDAPEFNHRELDIEFARWANASDPTNAQYVVQPYDAAGNLVRFLQPSNVPQSVHSLTWEAASATFRSLRGHDPYSTDPAKFIAGKTFTSGIPQPGGENARINLWLFRGRAPSNRQAVEVIINRFEYFR